MGDRTKCRARRAVTFARACNNAARRAVSIHGVLGFSGWPAREINDPAPKQLNHQLFSTRLKIEAGAILFSTFKRFAAYGRCEHASACLLYQPGMNLFSCRVDNHGCPAALHVLIMVRCDRQLAPCRTRGAVANTALV